MRACACMCNLCGGREGEGRGVLSPCVWEYVCVCVCGVCVSCTYFVMSCGAAGASSALTNVSPLDDRGAGGLTPSR